MKIIKINTEKNRKSKVTETKKKKKKCLLFKCPEKDFKVNFFLYLKKVIIFKVAENLPVFVLNKKYLSTGLGTSLSNFRTCRELFPTIFGKLNIFNAHCYFYDFNRFIY